MPWRAPLAFLLYLAAMQSARGAELRPFNCLNDFIAYLADRGDGDAELLAQLHEKSASKTVEIAGVARRGNHGGNILKLRRIGPTWNADHSEAPRAPQGDPRWFLEAMGEEAAKFFGFRRLNDEEMEAPDTDELNGAIEKINAKLGPDSPYRIAIRFYDSPDIPSINFFNETWRAIAGVPIAKGGGHRVHDLSYHSGAIFLPAEVVEQGQYVSAEVDAAANAVRRKLFELVGEKAKDREVREAINYYSVQLKSVGAINVDNGTAGGVTSLLYTQKTAEAARRAGTAPKFVPEDTYAGSLRFLYGSVMFKSDRDPGPQESAATAVRRLPMLVQKARDASPAIGAKAFKLNAVLDQALAGKNWSLEFFLLDYIMERKRQEPRFAALPAMSVEEGCQRSLLQFKAIRAAAEALQKEQREP